MRYVPAALACALCLGCSGGGSADNPDLATSPDSATSLSVSWTTTAIDIQMMTALSGVNVCIVPDNLVCAMTNAAGMATLTVPKNSEFMLSYALTNYVPQFTEHTSKTSDDGNTYYLVSMNTRGVLAAAVGKSIDSTKGTIVLSAITPTSQPLAGATFMATPSGGDGPYYFGGFGLPDSNAKSTSTNGLGFILNLAAGDFDINAMLAGKSCAGSPNKSWQGATAASAKARVMVGGITTVSIACM